MSMTVRQSAWLVALFWLLAVAAAMAARPLMPIDETRYITVAWEMHLADHWLVPLLNGEPYHHKPPLLFWLIRISWIIFGVNDLTPRLIAPAFGLGALLLTGSLARLLWPGAAGQRIGALAPVILVSGAWWLLFTTLTMFDLIVAFFALVGWIGLAMALRYGQMRTGFILFALAIGLGILAKGPVILVYTLPVALFAPLWRDDARAPRWGLWYTGLLLSILAGAAIGLAWALPAADAGGPAFKQALLWGQTAGRVKDSFAHKRAFWWYLPLLPVLLSPWLFWRPTWLAMWPGRAGLRDGGLRFCLLSALTGLVIFSLISGKQPHYLLPLAPAFAMLVARGLVIGGISSRSHDAIPAAVMLVIFAFVIASVPFAVERFPNLFRDSNDLPDWSLLVTFEIAACLLAGAAVAIWLGRSAEEWRRMAGMASTSLTLFLAVHLVGFSPARPAYDLRPAAQVIRQGQEQGRPVAYAGDYHGEYQWLGRLQHPLPEIKYADIGAWFANNPEGWVVARYREDRLRTGPKPLYAQQKRGRIMVIWDRGALLQRPDFFPPD